MPRVPLLTVVTPCLNAASTLPEALASVPAHPEIEHVVVDGGSTDGTTELLASAAGVRFVSEPDRWLSDAMNKGVAMATGEWIGWLNADDYYLPGALHRVLAALSGNPDEIWLTAPCLIVDGSGNEIRRGVTRYKRFFLRRYG